MPKMVWTMMMPASVEKRPAVRAAMISG